MRFIVSTQAGSASNGWGAADVTIWPGEDYTQSVTLHFDGKWSAEYKGLEPAAARQVVEQWVAGMFEEVHHDDK